MKIGSKKGKRWHSAIFVLILVLTIAYVGFFLHDNPLVDSKQFGNNRPPPLGKTIVDVKSNNNDDGNANDASRASIDGQTKKEQNTNDENGRPPKQEKEPPAAEKQPITLPACAAQGKAESFLMVFMGHSGSTAILSELSQHPQTYIKSPEPVDHNELKDDVDAALQFTEDFFNEGKSQGKIPGFKIRPRHILNRPEQWRQLLTKHNTRIIWQFRHNFFKQAVGEYSYRYLNDTSVVEGLRGNDTLVDRCKRGAGCHFPIHDMKYFHQMLRMFVVNDKLITKAVQTLDREGCTLPLAYEEYLYSHDDAMKQAFGFLGLESVKVAPLRAKATKDNLCQVIDNFEEVCHTFFACHSWRHMMTDSRNNCKVSFGLFQTLMNYFCYQTVFNGHLLTKIKPLCFFFFVEQCTQFRPAKLWAHSPFCDFEKEER